MKAQRRTFGFREDAIVWILKNGFSYVEFYGWCHPQNFCALVEHSGRAPRPWVLTVYASTVPKLPENQS